MQQRPQRPSHPQQQHPAGPTADAPARARRPLISWSRQTFILAAALSLFVHALVAYVLVGSDGGPPRGQVGAPDGAQSFAVMNEVEFDDIATSQLASQAEFESELNDPAADQAFSDPGASADVAALESGDVGDLGGATTTGEGELGGGAASFFGVSARGTRFAYVVDISGSMDQTRMSALVGALSRSLQGLLDEARFVVAMYNSGVEFAGPERWNPTTSSSINRTLGALSVYFRGGRGGTVPLPAFERVFEMRPKPDAIYFMTDGVFGDDANARLIAAAINRMNLESGRLSAIHCITLIDDTSADVMRSIAEASGGSYTHISGSGGTTP